MLENMQNIWENTQRNDYTTQKHQMKSMRSNNKLEIQQIKRKVESTKPTWK